MKRKAIQITVIKIGTAPNRAAFVAVANDGTIWAPHNDSIASDLKWAEWQQLPEIPSSPSTITKKVAQ